MIPSRMTYDISTHRHAEHLRHAERIREVQQARRDGHLTVDKAAHRRLTALRLSGALTVVRAAFHL